MARTSDRPFATELMPVHNTLAFGGLLTVASLALFAWVNLLGASSASLLSSSIASSTHSS